MDGMQTVFDSPIGVMTLAFEDDAVTGLDFRQPDRLDAPNAVAELALKELTEYFEGSRMAFETPLRLIGTPFRKAVWDQLLEVPYGQTATYGQIAARVGQPKAARAVGGANHVNPVSIIVPCHRIVGAAGLVGYGGGLWRKEWLLAHEGRVLNQ